MGRAVLLLIGLLLSAECLQAENLLEKFNQPNARAFNHFYYGFADCEAVTQKQMRALNGTVECTAADKDPLNEAAGFEILKKTLYDNSVHLYQEKHRCLAEYTKKVSKDPKNMDEFTDHLIPLYLNRKRAELILRQCENVPTISPSSVGGKRPSHAQEKNANLEFLKNDFYDVCKNKSSVEGLKSLIAMSDVALPFMSSKKPYELVDQKYRSLLVSSKTKKPLTDDEIMHLDLNSESEQMYYESSKTGPLKEDLIHYFQQKVEDHGSLKTKVSKGFSEENMRELFKEGSASQELDDIGLSEEESRKDPVLRNMRYCMKSTYEHNAFADAYNALAVFLILKEVTPDKWIAAAQQAKTSWMLDTAAATSASSKAWYTACLDPEKKQRVLLGGAPKDRIANFNIYSLPRGFNFRIANFSRNILKSIPSCQTASIRRLYLKTEHELTCTAEILASGAPAVISVPAAIWGPQE